MVNPTGYTALDLIGYTDKGIYSSSANYVKNDLVHYGGNIWRCLVDDTTGITPTEGATWTLFIGAPTNMAERMIAPLEVSPSANAYAVGEQLIFNDTLYKAKTAIAVGDTLVVDTNIELAPKVSSQIQTLTNQVGTNTNNISMLNTKATNKVLYLTGIACSALTGNFATVSNAAITADHVVAECVFANPSAITSDVTWTTASGSLVLNGTCGTATTVNVVLIKKDN